MSSLIVLDMQRLLILTGAVAALGALLKRGLLRRHWPVAVVVLLWAAETILAKGWPCARTREVYLAWEGLVACAVIAHAWRLGIPDAHLRWAAALYFLAAGEALLGHDCQGFYRPAAFLDTAAILCLIGARRWWIAIGQSAVDAVATWGLGLMLALQVATAGLGEFSQRASEAGHLGVGVAFSVTMFLITRAALARK